MPLPWWWLTRPWRLSASPPVSLDPAVGSKVVWLTAPGNQPFALPC